MESQLEHFKQKHPNEKMWLCLDHVVWSKLSTNRWVMLLLSLIPSRFYGKFFKTSYTLEWGPKFWSRIFHGLCTEISTRHLRVGEIQTKTKKISTDNGKTHHFSSILPLSINTRNWHFIFFDTEYDSLNNNYIFQLFSLSNSSNCQLSNCPDLSR